MLCPDMTSEWADVSVGVLEGKPDWNTMIIRTQTGDQLDQQMPASAGYLETHPMPAENLNHLCISRCQQKKTGIDSSPPGRLSESPPQKNRRAGLRLRTEVIERMIDSDTEKPCQHLIETTGRRSPIC